MLYPLHLLSVSGNTGCCEEAEGDNPVCKFECGSGSIQKFFLLLKEVPKKPKESKKKAEKPPTAATTIDNPPEITEVCFIVGGSCAAWNVVSGDPTLE